MPNITQWQLSYAWLPTLTENDGFQWLVMLKRQFRPHYTGGRYYYRTI